ncbi:MAG: pseudouridine synthase [Catonella sp.]
MEAVRINKYLSEAGVCSRRGADRLIEEGRVSVNGTLAFLGSVVKNSDEVRLDGELVSKKTDKILIAFNKPRGIVCTTADPKSKDVNIIEYINYPERIFPVGRLDKDSEGLILLSNDGDLSNKIMKARNFHEKEYEVEVDKPFDDEFLKRMSEGVPILDTVTRKCTLKRTGKTSFNIILTQGLNRQIRRMCEYFGYKVVRLKRIRIMNIKLGSLKSGTYRNITDKEYEELIKGLR